MNAGRIRTHIRGHSKNVARFLTKFNPSPLYYKLSHMADLLVKMSQATIPPSDTMHFTDLHSNCHARQKQAHQTAAYYVSL